MARPLRIEYPGAYYHVVQRGIERKNIFKSESDKEKFLSYLEAVHTAYKANIHTYCLMDNHYHLVVETPRANLSKVIHYINASYAMHFNTKHKRSGPLYQGRFKAVLVQQDEYLHHLSRYIHLNPVRAGIVEYPEKYWWSSYRYFTGEGNHSEWLNIDFILSMFDENMLRAKKQYKQFVLEEIGREAEVIKGNLKKGFILGNEDFLNRIKEKLIDKKDNPEIPVLKEMKNKKEVSLEEIEGIVGSYVKGDEKLKRRILLYLSRKYTQRTLREIAMFYGKIGDTGVTQAFKRVEFARKENAGMDRLLIKIEKEVSLSSVET